MILGSLLGDAPVCLQMAAIVRAVHVSAVYKYYYYYYFVYYYFSFVFLSGIDTYY